MSEHVVYGWAEGLSAKKPGFCSPLHLGEKVRALGFRFPIYKMLNVPSNISRKVTYIPRNNQRIPKLHFISYTKKGIDKNLKY